MDGTEAGDGVRRSCREGKRGLQLLLMLVAPPCGWFGEVRPEAMPSSSPAKESVSTAREVRSLSLDGPGKHNNAGVNADIYDFTECMSSNVGGGYFNA